MSNSKCDYLSVEDQALIANRIKNIMLDPSQPKMFIDNGAGFAVGALFASGIVFWRSAFRGYNLAKYGRRRIVTAMMPLLSSFQGGLFHYFFVKHELINMFRDESYWAYGLRSAFAHQLGLAVSFVTVTGFTFWHAHEIGILPTQKRIIVKGARREAFNIYLSKLKPYRNSLALTWAFSTAFMFTIGLLEYKQSRSILARLERKTLGLRES